MASADERGIGSVKLPYDIRVRSQTGLAQRYDGVIRSCAPFMEILGQLHNRTFNDQAASYQHNSWDFFSN